MANKITVIFLWLNGDNFIVFIYGRLIHWWVLCFQRSIDAFRLCTCLLMFFLWGFLLKWSICSAVMLMFVLIFILLCHQFGLRTPWSLCAQAGKCNSPNMTTLSVMSLDISRTFPTFTLRFLPLCGCDFCIKQQETLRHRCDPSLECYHGNRSRVWWTAEFGTLDLKVIQAVPSPGASHAH